LGGTIAKETKREVEAVLDKRVTKKTRGQTYYQYLIKWKGQPIEDASWMTTTELKKYHVDPEDFDGAFFSSPGV
jgi:hypothetical protein